MENNYGNFINSTNGGTTGENADNILNGMPQEKADSLAGVIQNPGYVGGFFGTTNSNANAPAQQVNTYVGGYIDATQNYGTAQQDYSYSNTQYVEQAGTNLPVKRGFWSKVKSFLFEKEVSIELTKKEQKVLTEVHDFLFQDISIKGFMDILKIGKKKQ